MNESRSGGYNNIIENTENRMLKVHTNHSIIYY